jgi:hypothetical protein
LRPVVDVARVLVCLPCSVGLKKSSNRSVKKHSGVDAVWREHKPVSYLHSETGELAGSEGKRRSFTPSSIWKIREAPGRSLTYFQLRTQHRTSARRASAAVIYFSCSQFISVALQSLQALCLSRLGLGVLLGSKRYGFVWVGTIEKYSSVNWRVLFAFRGRKGEWFALTSEDSRRL